MVENNQAKVDVYYVSDPLCSHCWGLEPELQKFLSQYGHYINFHTVMGGLIYNWDSFAGDARNHIYEAKDTTAHWREFAKTSGMPIDGSLMQDNPVTSSYPASQVVKLLQEKNHDIANQFLRKVREALFVHNQNISKRDVLIDIVNKLGENGDDIVQRALTLEYEEKVHEDKQLMRSLGAKVTPAVIFVNDKNRKFPRVGMNTAENFAKTLKRALRMEVLEKYDPDPLHKWLEKQDVIFAKEVEVMYELTPEEVKPFIERTLSEYTYELHEFQDTFYIKGV